MADFVKIARTTDLPDPGKETYEIDDSVVVLFHVDGQFYCLNDVCTHDGGPLGEGQLCDHAIACPRHGAQFDIRSGAPLTMPATEGTVMHEVKIDGDDIYVRLNED
jgi:3-phenylpropionate/trans-cinnamate dioxygenase ferredoxin component